MPTTQPETIEQFSIRVAEAWKIGRKNVDDGAILIVAKRSGLAVVGTPLVLNDQIVGAAVGGYQSVDFPQSVAISTPPTDWDPMFVSVHA